MSAFDRERALERLGNPRPTHTTISKEGFIWHYQHIIDNARNALKTVDFQLRESVDTDGTSHKKCAKAIADTMKRHLDAMEAFMEA